MSEGLKTQYLNNKGTRSVITTESGEPMIVVFISTRTRKEYHRRVQFLEQFGNYSYAAIDFKGGRHFIDAQKGMPFKIKGLQEEYEVTDVYFARIPYTRTYLKEQRYRKSHK